MQAAFSFDGGADERMPVATVHESSRGAARRASRSAVSTGAAVETAPQPSRRANPPVKATPKHDDQRRAANGDNVRRTKSKNDTALGDETASDRQEKPTVSKPEPPVQTAQEAQTTTRRGRRAKAVGNVQPETVETGVLSADTSPASAPAPRRASRRTANATTPTDVAAEVPCVMETAPAAPEPDILPPETAPRRARRSRKEPVAHDAAPTATVQAAVKPQDSTTTNAELVEAAIPHQEPTEAASRRTRRAGAVANTTDTNDRVDAQRKARAARTRTAVVDANTQPGIAEPAQAATSEQEPAPQPTRRAQRAAAAPEAQEEGEITLPSIGERRTAPQGPMFLMSYDDSPKRSIAEKIEAAAAAYQTRFARRPNLVLVHASVASEVEVADIAIERRSTVPPNNFWAGMQNVVRPASVE